MSPRTIRIRLGLLAAFAVLLGAVCAVWWATGAVLPTYVVQADGHATITDAQLGRMFSVDFWYTIVGAVAGLVMGTATWLALRRTGWAVAVLTAGLAMLAGMVCAWLGTYVGPGPFAERMAAAQPGDVVPVALELRSPSALAVWVFTAVAVPLFAASLGPEVDRVRTRREPAAEGAAPAAVDEPEEVR